ncbi:hypothetical protein ACFQZF_09400 [Flavobacterium myungsuense]|uniref:Host attachment protein n=1 Tax=Flavobacterium myungsuense TaxID=651823 RepID=A0ABW3J2T7_9FLAO
MKKQTGVWIDTSKAIIVKLENKQEYIVEIKSDIENRVHHKNIGNTGTFSGTRLNQNESKFDNKKKHQTTFFLNNVIEKIKNDDEIFVFGPAFIKTKLKQSIEKDKQLAPKLKLTKTSAALTPNQVVAKVKEFYNSKQTIDPCYKKY